MVCVCGGRSDVPDHATLSASNLTLASPLYHHHHHYNQQPTTNNEHHQLSNPLPIPCVTLSPFFRTSLSRPSRKDCISTGVSYSKSITSQRKSQRHYWSARSLLERACNTASCHQDRQGHSSHTGCYLSLRFHILILITYLIVFLLHTSARCFVLVLFSYPIGLHCLAGWAAMTYLMGLRMTNIIVAQGGNTPAWVAGSGRAGLGLRLRAEHSVAQHSVR